MPAEVKVRVALLSAAIGQLAYVAKRLGRSGPVTADDAARLNLAVATAQLEAAQRPFDAARARLWVAEEGSDATQAAAAAEVFERLRATPYTRRARALAPG